ncbi:MAG: hypothetical protein M1835_006034 [Candelina submexicana]|nr:MAG: hypothetical protein M1835_006034 [Candelina submexicana]
MANMPIITFKAGICDVDHSVTPPKVKPRATPGYLYLFSDDDLIHFCWRPRSVPASQPEIDLVMIPTDAQFKPYHNVNDPNTQPNSTGITNGRIYVLKFSSSSQRQLFWLQSKSQHPHGEPGYFSARDLKLGEIVNQLLQGEEVNVQEELTNASSGRGGPEGDNDEAMEDVEGPGGDPEHHRGGSGGAGADATGGDIREEGEGSREGGADGGRAASSSANDASAIVSNFLKSVQGSKELGGSQQQGQTKLFTTLPELLPSSTTIPMIESATESYVDSLLSLLPPTLLLLAQEGDDVSSVDPTTETAQAAMQALSLDQKKAILRKVLRSPQFTQSLGSLTTALRDGGLPSVSEALKVKVENGGLMRGGGMPLGGGDAIEAFLEGVKKTVKDTSKIDEGKMDTD